MLMLLLTLSLGACKGAAWASDLPDTASAREAGEKEDTGKGNAPVSYDIGDIVLDDGTVVKAAALDVLDEENLPVAVIAGFGEDGTAIGMGVHRSDAPLPWAEDDTENYPAAHFAGSYATTYDLTGECASGWYMPTIAQLHVIYDNREAINTALQKIYGLNNEASMDGLGTNWYWSSSQSDSQEDYAWFIHFFNGYAGECPKNFTNVHALAVRAF